jgi:muramidase (phage lysozyme)
MPVTKNISKNMQAFLDMIAVSEGTSSIRGSQDGYNVLVGGKLFPSYADHPRQRVLIPSLKLWSTAAGRYQVLARYFDSYKKLLHLPDFSPMSQDQIALQMIREQKATLDVENGDLAKAISKCRNLWASFPGAGYKQHEQKLDMLSSVYSTKGGILSQNWESIA